MADNERLSALTVDQDAELARVEREIRAKPDDAKLRTYLFQLLAIRGDWQRALAQLQVAAQLTPVALPMAQTYREAIRCEVFRAEVFAGKRTPSILGEPPAWMGLLLESMKALAEGHVARADDMRDEALDAAPPTPGTIDTTAFEWIADADSRIGPVCEAIVDGKYVWIPFERLSAISIEPPADLRDFVWGAAKLAFRNGGDAVALIPTRYPGSEASADGAIRMARKTAWSELSEATYVGLGQRMWATDAGEHAMLDTREIALTGAA